MERPLGFAVVREDPDVERTLLRASGAREVLLVASGGCTALELHHRDPALALTLLDMNPAQLDLVGAKYAELRATGSAPSPARWCVGEEDVAGPLGGGRFESLFRVLRAYLHEFVAGPEEIAAAFAPGGQPPRAAAHWTAAPLWPAAFDTAFADGLLRGLFGDAAVQHPPAAGYPRHFQTAFERGLRRADARTNRFLQLLLLGYARDEAECRPGYLDPTSGVLSARPPEPVLGRLEDVEGLDRFGLLSLSNVTDWMAPAERAALVRDLTARCRPGAQLLLRGIGSLDGVRALLGADWRLDDHRARTLRERARDLFYSDLLIATKS